MRNAEHYYDPTPYQDIQNIETGKERKMRVFAAERDTYKAMYENLLEKLLKK